MGKCRIVLPRSIKNAKMQLFFQKGGMKTPKCSLKLAEEKCKEARCKLG